jgi:hypothetical protein
MWPLLALMLAGGWIAWPWFAFYGLVMGSATRIREIALVVAGIVGCAIVAIFVVTGLDAAGVDARSVPAQLGLFAVSLWKLAIGYVVVRRQAASLELFEYLHGSAAGKAFIVLLPAFLLRKEVLLAMPHWLLRISLG